MLDIVIVLIREVADAIQGTLGRRFGVAGAQSFMLVKRCGDSEGASTQLTPSSRTKSHDCAVECVTLDYSPKNTFGVSNAVLFTLLSIITTLIVRPTGVK